MRWLKEWQRKNWFGEIVRAGQDELHDSSHILRLYVLVRDDILPPLHQGIQAAHACLLLASRIPVDPNSYLILLGANHVEMIRLAKFKISHKKSAMYFDQGLVEPEVGFPLMTAVAFEPMSLAEGNKLFGHLKRAE